MRTLGARRTGAAVIFASGYAEAGEAGRAQRGVDARDAEAEGPKRELKSLLVGGSENNPSSFEGKIDEVALFDRALGAPEIGRQFAASVADTPSPSKFRE